MTTKQTKATESTAVRKAIADHAVGKPQRPRTIGPLEVTNEGLVLHVDPDFVADITKPGRRK